MPGETWYMKNGDRLPALQGTLTDGNGNPANLAGATVTFNMKDSTGASKIADAACTIVNAAGGIVSYTWGASDTTTSGTFTGEFAVNIGGLEQTYPNSYNIVVVIMDALG